jgi:signal transduction histidine kinase
MSLVARTQGPVAEKKLLRRTRRRLVLWSAGSTLIVLLVLGTILYVAVARLLASDSENQLIRRAQIMASVGSIAPIRSPVLDGAPLGLTIAPDAAAPGLLFGGPVSGTIAFVTDSTRIPGGIEGPDPDALQKALSGGGSTMRETVVPMVQDPPIRVFTTSMELDGKTYAIQVISDRSTEVRTLELTLLVLVLGGLVALGASVLVGWVYAGRALVPIRDSLTRQREFAANASHELRSPLTAIRSNIEVLEAGRSGPADPEVLADIRSEAAQMTTLVEQLLLLARADAEGPEQDPVPTDLAEAAADAVDGLAAVAAELGLRLTMDIEPVVVRGDPVRLRQLVTILADNALRHAANGGQCRVSVSRQGHDAVLVVEDDGPGIRPDDLPRVFDRFWRAADAPPGGSGLGLSIAAWIVDQHGGTIEAMNAETGGARFRVELPAI